MSTDLGAPSLTRSLRQEWESTTYTYDNMDGATNETIALAPSGHNGNVGYGLDPVGTCLSEASSLEGIPSGSWSFNGRWPTLTTGT
jgi:hypothetical protein